MEIPREELERLMFYEHLLKTSAAEYKRSPKDADNLTRWGQALMELAHFRPGPESLEMLEDAMSKFNEALSYQPKKHETLWCLGNALTAQGFLIADSERANQCFKEASATYQKALNEEPENRLYKNSLEMTEKAPALHQDLQKQLIAQQALATLTAPPPTAPADGGKAMKKKRKEYSELKYDVIGWVVLTVAVVAFLGLSNRGAQAAPISAPEAPMSATSK